MTPWKLILLSLSLDIGMPIPFSVSAYRIFRPLPPSIRTLISRVPSTDYVRRVSTLVSRVPWTTLVRGGYVRRVIGLVECDGRLRPFRITGCHRSDHVDFSVDNFQSTL